MSDQQRLEYSNKVYNVRTEQDARFIILTPTPEQSAADRWRTETPYLIDLINKNTQVGDAKLVLDYGCGIGRLSRELLIQYQSNELQAVGVDSSWSMRALAINYCRHERFFPVSREMLLNLEVKADIAIASWVLQHCKDPEEDILAIKNSIKIGGELFVLNEKFRCVPTSSNQWANDGIDIQILLKDHFEQIVCRAPSKEIMGQRAHEGTFWGVYKRTER